jgi:hypothetical protein
MRKLRLYLPQSLALRFCALEIRNVNVRADIAGEFSPRISRNATLDDPTVFAIRPPEPILHPERLSGMECGQEAIEAPLHIIRMHAFRPAGAHFLLHASASELEPWLVEIIAKRIRSGHPNRISYRVRQLQRIYGGFAMDSQARWQTDTLWQPLRIAMEKLLICYDWAESFVALNLVLKPLMDEIFMNHFSDLALREGDYLLGQVFYSLNEDCRWHREWSQALTRMVIEDNSHNSATIQGWIEKWHPVAARAVEAFAPLFEGKLEDAQMPPLEGVTQKLDKFYRDYLSAMGLQPSGSASLLF